jgi:hypothetical protein
LVSIIDKSIWDSGNRDFCREGSCAKKERQGEYSKEFFHNDIEKDKKS